MVQIKYPQIHSQHTNK